MLEEFAPNLFRNFRARQVKHNFEKYRRLNDRYNFAIPNFVLYWKGNSKWTSLINEDWVCNLESLKENNLSDLVIYIWRVEKSLQWRPYTEQFLMEMLNFMIINTQKWDKVRIGLWNFVWETLNGSDSSRYFTVGEQIKYLKSLISRMNKGRLSDFIITDLKMENRDLFDCLKSKKTEAREDQDNLTSSWIYAALKGLSLKNTGLKELLESPKPNNANSHNDYSLVEISIRIADMLKWNNFQWWSRLQSKLDNIIAFLVNPSIPVISYKSSDSEKKKTFSAEGFIELEDLRKLFKDKIGDNGFKFMYFDTDECERFYQLKECRDKDVKTTINKFRNIIMWIVLGAVWVWVPIEWRMHKKQEEYQQKLMESVWVAMEDREIMTAVEWPWLAVIKKQSQKVDTIALIAFNVIEDLALRYWVVDKKSQDIIFWLILSELPNDEISRHYVMVWDESKKQRMEFADRFVNKYRTFLIANKISTEPYAHFKSIEKEFRYTINNEESWIKRLLQDVFNVENISPDKYSYFYEELWKYTKIDGTTSEIVRLRSDPRVKQWMETWATNFLLRMDDLNDTLLEVKKDFKDTEVIVWADVAYDYFWQTRKELRDVYAVLMNIYFEGTTDYDKHRVIRKILIKEYANNEKSIRDEIRKRWTADYTMTVFMKKYRKAFEDWWLKPVFYDNFTKEKAAFVNTSEYMGDFFYYSLREVTYLWVFVADDWDKYLIGKIYIGGKPYVCCMKNDITTTYELNPFRAKKIAEEYLRRSDRI
ncbi:MAG: hypothetical protein ACD_2C00131G0019 [uncultured bacterium (gcode 4)]|uniref:Uncharacterized protein n=1 Tax=uncultured bacterium (gcode 4) TaxID=1234023 RepID=K2GGX9_9BACT|nr:MAG: hypothetical protein ACD_2C00131G0019 [uncultured bacterium (gcode 4)]